jgi:hypothetical protein
LSAKVSFLVSFLIFLDHLKQQITLLAKICPEFVSVEHNHQGSMVKFHKHSGIQGYQLKQKIKDYYEKPRVSSCPPASSGQSHKQGYKSAFSPFQANVNSVGSVKN